MPQITTTERYMLRKMQGVIDIYSDAAHSWSKMQTFLAGITLSDRTVDQILYTATGGLVTSDATFKYNGTTFDIGAGNFTVDQATGNTLVAGTFGVTGDVAVNTNKFTIAAATGNTLVAGTLTVSTLTSGRVPFMSTAGLVIDDVSVAYDNVMFKITGNTLPNDGTKNWLNVTGTLPTTPSAGVVGASISVTSAGSASQTQAASTIILGAGYTGASQTFGMLISNSARGTGTFSTLATINGNMGFQANVHSANNSTGYNVGNFSSSEGAIRNVGQFGRAINATGGAGTPAYNIGVWGGASGATANIGVYATIGATGAGIVWSNVSAALVANNNDSTSPIFLAQDGGSTVFTIANGGGVTATGTLTLSARTTGQVLYTSTGGLVISDTTFKYNGTTFALGTDKFTVAQATGITSVAGAITIDKGATPTGYQLLAQANSLGALSLFCYSADNVLIGFDSRYTAGNHVATDTTAAIIYKIGDALNFYFDGSLTPGGNYTPTNIPLKLTTSGIHVVGTASIPGQVLYARRYAAAYG